MGLWGGVVSELAVASDEEEMSRRAGFPETAR